MRNTTESRGLVPDSHALHQKWQALRNQVDGNEALRPLSWRIERAISWLGQAERAEDQDSQFIFLWIGFNAAYAKDIKSDKSNRAAKQEFLKFFKAIRVCDKESRVLQVIRDECRQEIQQLLNNQWVYEPFWKRHVRKFFRSSNWHQASQNDLDGIISLDASLIGVKMRGALSRVMGSLDGDGKDMPSVLAEVFERLYVLRNQLFHGGATWNSPRSRDQVQSGSKIMSRLLPIFIDLMLDNPRKDWGPPWYPRIKDIRSGHV